jgi:hypothetical protein
MILQIPMPLRRVPLVDQRELEAWHLASAAVIFARNSGVHLESVGFTWDGEGQRLGFIECDGPPAEPIHKLMIASGYVCEQLVLRGPGGMKSPAGTDPSLQRLWDLAYHEVRLGFRQISVLAHRLAADNHIPGFVLRQDLNLPPEETRVD